MKQSKKKLIRKLQNEELNLNSNIEKLISFMESEDYKDVEALQKSLLSGQLAAMRLYQKYLLDRINDLEGRKYD